jgi:hypothetical protein
VHLEVGNARVLFGLFTGLEAINTMTLLLEKYLAFTIASNIADNNQQILNLCKIK